MAPIEKVYNPPETIYKLQYRDIGEDSIWIDIHAEYQTIDQLKKKLEFYRKQGGINREWRGYRLTRTIEHLLGLR